MEPTAAKEEASLGNSSAELMEMVESTLANSAGHAVSPLGQAAPRARVDPHSGPPIRTGYRNRTTRRDASNRAAGGATGDSAAASTTSTGGSSRAAAITTGDCRHRPPPRLPDSPASISTQANILQLYLACIRNTLRLLLLLLFPVHHEPTSLVQMQTWCHYRHHFIEKKESFLIIS
ncbi:hypothetical protein BDA96_05G055400 [Sorghum bicolor]|uniref:Uncharacterized protein n=2 Tax=Sorghum bicolor TaxID=4558 RepID=A0A921QVG1_SORBI|nr:hypothetical protein BDA96_05G055400 [Sorghum bicolor]OQU82956.1 hypothetical protein SORBI_3005G052400 [Sorghum bicolor]